METRCCSPTDFGFSAVYAHARFTQNRVNDDRMRQSLLFRVRVSEEKERHRQGERNWDTEFVCIHEGVCESEHVLVKTEKKRYKRKKKRLEENLCIHQQGFTDEEAESLSSLPKIFPFQPSSLPFFKKLPLFRTLNVLCQQIPCEAGESFIWNWFQTVMLLSVPTVVFKRGSLSSWNRWLDCGGLGNRSDCTTTNLS